MAVRRRGKWLVLGMLCLLIVGVWAIARELRWLPAPAPDWARLGTKARAFCNAQGVAYPLQQPSVRIEKRARKLYLLEQGKPIAEFPIALSRAAVGDKVREGDRKTPEGDYYVCEKHPSRRFYLFLGLSYPALKDAVRGKAQGQISETQYQAIQRAIQSGVCPPWDTPLGGAIGIHGGGVGRDWTLGCIALRDEDVELLYMLLPIGTPVRISP
ncbi:MAG: L,D-transpeptidase family protein [bacterium]|nr:L,D-transpeptidase family protein [bacterium]